MWLLGIKVDFNSYLFRPQALAGHGLWSPKGDLGLLGDLFPKIGLLLVSFLLKSLLFVQNYVNTMYLRDFIKEK